METTHEPLTEVGQRCRSSASDAELLAILAELAREVSSVLDLDDLLEKIPHLISRLTSFTVFSVYLLDEKREELSIAYAVGYPEEIVKHFTLRVGQGTVGTAVAEQRPILLNDVDSDPRYLAVVPGARSQLAVPLRNKGQVIGALNLLSDRLGAFTERDEWILRQFGAHVAQAIATARLFESEREYAETLETLAEIGREMSAILDPDELLTRLAHLIKRVIDYRIFGIALLNEDTQMLEMKVAIRYGDDPRAMEPVKLGEGLVGYAALHKEVVLVPDVTKDPRYIHAVAGRALGAGGAAAVEGPLHRRVRPREPGARRVQQETRQAADAAGLRSRGRDRERPPLRVDPRQRSALREGIALRPARADGAAAAGAAEAAARRGRGVAFRSGARARRRPLRFPRAGTQHAGGHARRRVGQRRAGGALRRRDRRDDPRPHVPAPAREEEQHAGRACWRA